MLRKFSTVLFALLAFSSAGAAATSIQMGVNQGTSPPTICAYDTTNTCQSLLSYYGLGTFTAGVPLIGNGAGAITSGARSGNTTAFVTESGGFATSGRAVKTDASGNLVDAGGAPLITGTTVTVAQGGTGATTLGSGLPLFGAGTSAITTGTLSGNTTKVVTTTGALTSTHCVDIDASGNFTDAGGPCTTGTGVSGLANQIAYYATSGTSISGLATANNGVLVTNGSGVPSISTTLPTGLTIPAPTVTGYAQFLPATPNWTSSVLAQVDGVSVNTGSFPANAVFAYGLGALYSNLTGYVDAPIGTTLYSVQGVMGYARGGGSPGPGVVGGQFVGLISTDLANNVFGANSVVSNSALATGPAGAGFNTAGEISFEADTNIIKRLGVAPTLTATGILVSGWFETQPTGNMDGILIQSSGPSGHPGWKNGIEFAVGSVGVPGVGTGAAIQFNPQALTASTNSQLMSFYSYSSVSTYVHGTMYLDPTGDFVFTGPVETLAATGSASLYVDNATAGQQGFVRFIDGATAEYDLLKETDNSFKIIDYASGSLVALKIASGSLYLGEAGQSVNISGLNLVTPTLYINSIASSAGSGGLYVCIDTAGLTYKKSSCP